MRILHLSDTHLGAELRVRGAPRGWSRAAEHHVAMERALAPALEEQVDLVVHTGDLFDRAQPPKEAVAAAVVLLAKVSRRVPVVLMPGNHDKRGLSPHVADLPGVHVYDQPGRYEQGGAALALVPFCRDAREWALAAQVAVGQGVDLLFAHQSFDGSRVPGFRFRSGYLPETVPAVAIPRGVRLVATGHIHPRQAMQLGGATVVHTGSTERTSFSEQHETKGTTLWELGRRLEWRFQDLPSRPMRWIADPAEIERIVPEELVGLARELRTVEHEDAALAKGAWLTGRPARAPKPRPPAPERQGGLF